MNLPAYLPPMLAVQSQMPTASTDPAPRRPALAVPALDAVSPVRPDETDRAARMAQRPEALDAIDPSLPQGQDPAGDAAASILEREALALQELADVRARVEDGQTVDPPVPVTQILQIVMGDKGALDPAPMAASSAKALYENTGAMFARDRAMAA